MPEVSGEYAWMGAALQRHWGGKKGGTKRGGKILLFWLWLVLLGKMASSELISKSNEKLVWCPLGKWH